MSDEDCLRLAALLEDALESLEAGEAYAHHARRPVEKALQEVRRIQKQEEQSS